MWKSKSQAMIFRILNYTPTSLNAGLIRPLGLRADFFDSLIDDPKTMGATGDAGFQLFKTGKSGA